MVSSLLPLAYWSALGVLTGILNFIWILLVAMLVFKGKGVDVTVTLEWGTLTVAMRKVDQLCS